MTLTVALNYLYAILDEMALAAKQINDPFEYVAYVCFGKYELQKRKIMKIVFFFQIFEINL